MRSGLFLLVVFLIVGSFTVHAQAPVNVVTDSPQTMMTRIMEAQDRAQQLMHIVEQVMRANQMVQNQLIALEKLQEGDFYGLVQAYSAQTRAMHEFNQIVHRSTFLQEQMDDSDDFLMRSQMLTEQMYATDEMLVRTARTVENAERRHDQMQRIQDQARSADGTVAQLQLQNQSLSLLNMSLADVNRTLAAANQHYAVQARRQEMREESAAEHERRFMSERSQTPPNHTEGEWRDIVGGGRILEDGGRRAFGPRSQSR